MPYEITKIPNDIQRVALRKLRMIHNAQNLADLRSPLAIRLEKLSGDRNGRYSLCFFIEG